jgi:hypothetical protein
MEGQKMTSLKMGIERLKRREVELLRVRAINNIPLICPWGRSEDCMFPEKRRASMSIEEARRRLKKS